MPVVCPTVEARKFQRLSHVREPYTGRYFVGGIVPGGRRQTIEDHFISPPDPVQMWIRNTVWISNGKRKTENRRRKAYDAERHVVLYTRTYFRVRVKRINYNGGGRTVGRTARGRRREIERNLRRVRCSTTCCEARMCVRVCMYVCVEYVFLLFFFLDRRTIAP